VKRSLRQRMPAYIAYANVVWWAFLLVVLIVNGYVFSDKFALCLFAEVLWVVIAYAHYINPE